MWRETLLSLSAAYCLAACTEPPSNSTDDELSDELMLHVPSPDWRDQVIYMVFIDRFSDGDPNNNDLGFGEYRQGSAAHFNGGDLQGVIDKLDYIQGLGATSVWVSPPVKNQVLSSLYDAAGWHGYWATDFANVDEHFGTLGTYQQLSNDLHRRGMYLVQDIVVNHTGNFFGWDGPYNAEDTLKNFVLFEEGEPYGDRPIQPPFDKVDRRDPENVDADIYHWTPPITNFSDPTQEKSWQLGNLADINTSNPAVIRVLTDTYADWIEKAGVDAFRIDTVRYVEQPFWNAFMHGPAGILDKAADFGRTDFLAFGETFVGSEPYAADGEAYISSFFGTDAEPGLNSMIGFPLYFSSLRVFGEGAPTSQLAYRLEASMEAYADPYTIANFIDNHDTARFLTQGSREGFMQALVMLYTIPGIPVIFQGTEQFLKETRQTMFEGGFGTDEDQFNADSVGYRLLADLGTLRGVNSMFTRGDLSVLASEPTGPGLLAYRRSHEGQQAFVFFNTASHSIFVQGVDTNLEAGTVLVPMFGDWPSEQIVVAEDGSLSMTLPPKASWVLKPSDRRAEAPAPFAQSLYLDTSIDGATLSADEELRGQGAVPGEIVSIIRNNNLEDAMRVTADDAGAFRIPVKVENLGREAITLQGYAMARGAYSNRVALTTSVDEVQAVAQVVDPERDDAGPDGRYIRMQQPNSGAQKDLRVVTARVGGANLELILTMGEVTNGWQPPNGFDNLMLSIFFDVPDREGTSVLPQMNANLPNGDEWDISHIATGWSSAMYGASEASADDRGATLGLSPSIEADLARGEIRVLYRGEPLGVKDWTGTSIYVATWDSTQEAGYAELQPEPANWHVGGGASSDPKIMDDARLNLSE